MIVGGTFQTKFCSLSNKKNVEQILCPHAGHAQVDLISPGQYRLNAMHPLYNFIEHRIELTDGSTFCAIVAEEGPPTGRTNAMSILILSLTETSAVLPLSYPCSQLHMHSKSY